MTYQINMAVLFCHVYPVSVNLISLYIELLHSVLRIRLDPFHFGQPDPDPGSKNQPK